MYLLNFIKSINFSESIEFGHICIQTADYNKLDKHTIIYYAQSLVLTDMANIRQNLVIKCKNLFEFFMVFLNQSAWL